VEEVAPDATTTTCNMEVVGQQIPLQLIRKCNRLDNIVHPSLVTYIRCWKVFDGQKAEINMLGKTRQQGK
jgi:hypothetical protein